MSAFLNIWGGSFIATGMRTEQKSPHFDQKYDNLSTCWDYCYLCHSLHLSRPIRFICIYVNFERIQIHALMECAQTINGQNYDLECTICGIECCRIVHVFNQIFTTKTRTNVDKIVLSQIYFLFGSGHQHISISTIPIFYTHRYLIEFSYQEKFVVHGTCLYIKCKL